MAGRIFTSYICKLVFYLSPVVTQTLRGLARVAQTLPGVTQTRGRYFLETLNYSPTALFKNINSSLAKNLMPYGLKKCLKDMGIVWRTWEEFEGLGKSLKVLGRVWWSWEEFDGLEKNFKVMGRVSRSREEFEGLGKSL
jgi:hypothetical protein